MARMRPPHVPPTSPDVVKEDENRRLIGACDGRAFDDRRDAAIVRGRLAEPKHAQPLWRLGGRRTRSRGTSTPQSWGSLLIVALPAASRHSAEASYPRACALRAASARRARTAGHRLTAGSTSRSNDERNVALARCADRRQRGDRLRTRGLGGHLFRGSGSVAAHEAFADAYAGYFEQLAARDTKRGMAAAMVTRSSSSSITS